MHTFCLVLVAELDAKLRGRVPRIVFALCWCCVEATCLVTSLSPWCAQESVLEQTVHWNDLVSPFTGVTKGHFFVQEAWKLDLYRAAPDSFLKVFCCCSRGDFGGGPTCSSSSLESLPLVIGQFSAMLHSDSNCALQCKVKSDSGRLLPRSTCSVTCIIERCSTT